MHFSKFEIFQGCCKIDLGMSNWFLFAASGASRPAVARNEKRNDWVKLTVFRYGQIVAVYWKSASRPLLRWVWCSLLQHQTQRGVRCLLNLWSKYHQSAALYGFSCGGCKYRNQWCELPQHSHPLTYESSKWIRNGVVHHRPDCKLFYLQNWLLEYQQMVKYLRFCLNSLVFSPRLCRHIVSSELSSSFLNKRQSVSSSASHLSAWLVTSRELRMLRHCNILQCCQICRNWCSIRLDWLKLTSLNFVQPEASLFTPWLSVSGIPHKLSEVKLGQYCDSVTSSVQFGRDWMLWQCKLTNVSPQFFAKSSTRCHWDMVTMHCKMSDIVIIFC